MELSVQSLKRWIKCRWFNQHDGPIIAKGDVTTPELRKKGQIVKKMPIRKCLCCREVFGSFKDLGMME